VYAILLFCFECDKNIWVWKIFNKHMKSLKNVILVSDVLFKDSTGGSARIVDEMTKGLKKKLKNLYIICTYTKSSIESKNVHIMPYAFRLEKKIFRFFNDFIKKKKIIKKIQRNLSIDLIIFNHPYSALGIVNAKEFSHISKVYIYHSPWHTEYWLRKKNPFGYFFRYLLEKKVLKDCDLIFVLSNYIKRLLQKNHKINERKIKYLKPGIDLERFNPKDKNTTRQNLNLPKNKFLIFTLRNLVPRMGLENLIIATKIIIEKKPNVALVIGGHGYLEKKLKTLTQKLNLSNHVIFTGFIKDEDLPLFYQASDLFVLPTRSLEGFGLVILEAWACGVPVVGTPIGAIPEVLSDFDKSLLTEDSDAKSLAFKILEFMNYSEERKKILRENCRKWAVENYNWRLNFELFFETLTQNINETN
jgi:glycosyltransferase involved in cell wall biosynthesis